ncbi:hypothetical protein VIBNIFTn2_360017 [Vibrio nigripulchritudo FTn2]|nr:hypothetical protein VIBNIAM115_840016 [Vibrio nigripulchritudo AM115]CCN42683.1 hypothetical protein VIBNIFTn2_360017 [Vibrio nigripulchritudo FTn2]
MIALFCTRRGSLLFWRYSASRGCRQTATNNGITMQLNRYLRNRRKKTGNFLNVFSISCWEDSPFWKVSLASDNTSENSDNSCSVYTEFSVSKCIKDGALTIESNALSRFSVAALTIESNTLNRFNAAELATESNTLKRFNAAELATESNALNCFKVTELTTESNVLNCAKFSVSLLIYNFFSD